MTTVAPMLPAVPKAPKTPRAALARVTRALDGLPREKQLAVLDAVRVLVELDDAGVGEEPEGAALG